MPTVPRISSEHLPLIQVQKLSSKNIKLQFIMAEKFAETESSILEDLADEEGIRKLIECPICLEIPLPPIYLCAKGHIVCNSCQSRTYTCPLCRERYCNTRSFVAEGIVEKCNLRCRHSDSGCTEVMKGSDLVEHLTVCDFRPVKCRECGNKPINYIDYENHLFKDHKLNGTQGTEAYVAYKINLSFLHCNIETSSWPQYYIKAFDKIFLLRLNSHQFTINPWVCLLGSKSECEKYTVLIEYEPSNDGGIVHSWRGPVNHFRDEASDVISQGRSLCVSMDTILDAGAVSTERAEWIYHIVVTKKSPVEQTQPSPKDTNLSSTETTSSAPNTRSTARDISSRDSCKESDIDLGRLTAVTNNGIVTEDELPSPRRSTPKNVLESGVSGVSDVSGVSSGSRQTAVPVSSRPNRPNVSNASNVGVVGLGVSSTGQKTVLQQRMFNFELDKELEDLLRQQRQRLVVSAGAAGDTEDSSDWEP